MMNTCKHIISGLLFCGIVQGAIGQKIHKFTYGGKGKRYNGSVQVRCLIQNNGRNYKVPDSLQFIDLNDYKGDVFFLIRFSELKLGLNSSFSKVKNSTHPKVFYLKTFKNKIHIDGYTPIGNDTIRIGSSPGHYGKEMNDLVYKIHSLKKKKKLLFQVKLK